MSCERIPAWKAAEFRNRNPDERMAFLVESAARVKELAFELAWRSLAIDQLYEDIADTRVNLPDTDPRHKVLMLVGDFGEGEYVGSRGVEFTPAELAEIRRRLAEGRAT